MVQPLWKAGRQLLEKSETELPSDPTVPLWGVYPKELKTRAQTAIYTPTVTALFGITKTGKQPKCPRLDEWIRKMGVHAHNRMVFGLKSKF